MNQKIDPTNSLEIRYDFLKKQIKNLLDGKSIEPSELFDDEINQSIKKNQKQKDSLKLSDRIFNLSLDLFSIVGIDGYFKYLNPAWERVLGWSSDELMSKPFKEFVHPDDQDNSIKAISRLIDGNEVLRFENRYICKDGSVIWLSWNAQPFLEENILIGVARDVTESKTVETELLIAKNRAEENERQFRQLFENMEQGFALHEMIFDDKNDPVDYRFILINNAFEKLTNTKASDFIGKTVKQVLPKTEQIWIDNYGKVAQTGEPMHFEHFSQEFDKYYDVTAYSPKKGFFATIFTDSTIRRKWEKEMNQYVQYLENLNNSLIDVVFTVDPETRKIRYVNNAVELVFGYSNSECIGSNTSLLYSEKKDYIEFGAKLKETIFSNKDFLKAEMQLKRKNGEVFTAEITTSFIKYSGKIVEILSIVRDISEKINYRNELIKAKEKAEESEKRFQLFVNQSPSPIAVVDSKMEQILYWSESATKKLGHTPKTVSEWFSVAYPDSEYQNIVAERWYAMLEKAAISKKATNTGEYDITCKDGSVITGEFYVQFIADQVIISLNDITERKKNEKALKESEENLKLIVENGTNLFYRHDVNHQLKYVSPQIKNILGYEVEEAMVVWTDLVTDNPINEIGYEFTMRAIKTGKRQDVYDLELKHKNGSKIHVEVREAPIVKNGKTVEIVGALADVTEKRETENALRESEVKFRSIFDQSPVGSVIVGLDKRFVRCNASFCNFLGYSENEIIGHTIAEYTHPDDIDIGMKELQQLVNGSIESTKLQKRYIRKNSATVWGEVSIRLVRDDQQKPLYFLPVIQDITRRKQIEQDLIIAKEKAEESDRLKTAFLANMSHEIRTPMNGILGFTNLLKEPNLPANNQKMYIDIIQKSGDRMLSTVNDIIEISKIETGLVTTSSEKVNVNKHFSTLYHFFKLEAGKKGLNLVIGKKLPEEDCRTLVDKSKFSSILTNLIKNAIKFTYKGTISFGCEKKGEFLEFYVKDTGVGIPQNRLEAVFNRFEQADIEDTRAFEGSGLGLTIAKSYVEMLGGQIWVKSEAGKGSTFFFTIPAIKPEPSKIDVSKSEKPAIDKHKKLVFLIAEDDEVSKMHLSLLLKDIAENIFDVSNGLDAVEAVRNNPDVDIILMDIRMPKMDGMEATQKIREFNKEIVIIAQTAFALEGDREKMLDAGCTDYISKPINKIKLMELVKKYS